MPTVFPVFLSQWKEKKREDWIPHMLKNWQNKSVH